jgi:hypothetical protein
VVESPVQFLFTEGATQREETTFCRGVLDGELPIDDAGAGFSSLRHGGRRLPASGDPIG